ncbi:MAG: hypothetical protein HY662_01695 [Chloroflexi bacterium]|nr:hypothetical protein [Chloroflexota bacterium]
MDIEVLLQQVLNFAGTFNLQLLGFLFLVCFIGEFGFAAPYLLETLWLLSGYHLFTGTFSISQVLSLWLVAQFGRQGGATLIYYSSLLGSKPLARLYSKYQTSAAQKLPIFDASPFKLLRNFNFFSPFSVTMGRLLWLRIPITIALGVRKQLGTLALGIALSSVIWDSIYILVGVAGGRVIVKPVQMVLFSVVGLTTLYATTFAIRRLSRRIKNRKGTELQEP